MRCRVASMVCALGAGTACSALWGIDELTYEPRGDGGAASSAATGSGGSDAGGHGATVQAGSSASSGGATPGPPPIDCLDALQKGRSVGDGVYTIDIDGETGPLSPMQVYCDMTTADGGWTLVYAYTFTNYRGFTTDSNAVTPRPSWPLNVGDSVPISNTTPMSLTDYNAMDFALWPSFGTEFLVTSNITNWVRCRALNGSLVDNVSGGLDCDVLTNITTICAGIAPNNLIATTGSDCRPALQFDNGLYICWDGRTNNHWPTHDPCGANGPNQLPNITDPRGAIFLRRDQP